MGLSNSEVIGRFLDIEEQIVDLAGEINLQRRVENVEDKTTAIGNRASSAIEIALQNSDELLRHTRRMDEIDLKCKDALEDVATALSQLNNLMEVRLPRLTSRVYALEEQANEGDVDIDDELVKREVTSLDEYYDDLRDGFQEETGDEFESTISPVSSEPKQTEFAREFAARTDLDADTTKASSDKDDDDDYFNFGGML